MTFGPVISSPRLPKHEVIGPENLAEWPRSDGVHGTRLQIHQDGAWDVPASTSLVVIDINAFKLEIGVTAVFSCVVNAMLVADHFPELCSDLVPTLSALDVKNFSHFLFFFFLFVSRNFLFVSRESAMKKVSNDSSEIWENGWDRERNDTEVLFINIYKAVWCKNLDSILGYVWFFTLVPIVDWLVRVFGCFLFKLLFQ